MYIQMCRQGFFVTESAGTAYRQIQKTILWNVWNFSANDKN